MPVKSWVTSPSGEPGEALKAGKTQIQGLAFGGMSAAKSVEVSVDGGKNWVPAHFVGPDLDELHPNKDQLLKVMMEGMGAMPSFAESLSDEEREAIATYVSSVAGQ